MRFTGYSFGSIRVDGMTYDHDLIIDRGKIRKRKKAASRKFRGASGHTPLSVAEDIPWRCRRLVIGTGADGALPVMQQVRDEARRRKVDLVDPAHGGGDRSAGQGRTGHQRHLAPDLLKLRSSTGNSLQWLRSFSAPLGLVTARAIGSRRRASPPGRVTVCGPR